MEIWYTGIHNGSYEYDFWEYDPDNDIWTEKNSIADVTDEDFDDDYSGITGIGKTAFTVGNRAYVVTGGASTTSSTAWEYDSETDLWELKTSLEGTSRIDAVSFTIENTGYVTTGRNGSYYFDDIWAFEPDAEYDEYD